MRHAGAFVAAFALVGAADTAQGAKLRPETLRAWERYVSLTEARIEGELSGADDDGLFLALDFFEPSETSRCRREIRDGGICIAREKTRDEEGKTIDVPFGLIHHWYGAVFLPGASLSSVLDWVQTYEGREAVYREVEDSRLISRTNDDFRIFLRLRRQKVVTAVYDTEHHVRYRSHGEGRASSRSVATHVREIDNPGSAREEERPAGDDRGFLWRLNSYWRFQQVDGGTIVECESLSLSRSIPAAARWFVRAFLTSVPRESLEQTLGPMRQHLGSAASAGSSRR